MTSKWLLLWIFPVLISQTSGTPFARGGGFHGKPNVKSVPAKIPVLNHCDSDEQCKNSNRESNCLAVCNCKTSYVETQSPLLAKCLPLRFRDKKCVAGEKCNYKDSQWICSTSCQCLHNGGFDQEICESSPTPQSTEVASSQPETLQQNYMLLLVIANVVLILFAIVLISVGITFRFCKKPVNGIGNGTTTNHLETEEESLHSREPEHLELPTSPDDQDGLPTYEEATSLVKNL